MNIYITRTYGLKGTADKAQGIVVSEAKKLGIEEIRIPNLPHGTEERNAVSKKIDGVLTGVQPGDTVIYQSPTWNDPNFDIFFMNKLLGIGNLNIIIFIHDVRPMMFPVEEVNLPAYIQLYAIASGLIVPSENMAQYLREKGVNTPMTVQHIWDSDVQIDFWSTPELKKEISFIGNDEKFMISKNFPTDIDTTLELYGRKNEHMVQADNIHYHGFLDEYSLLQELHKGGFGLVWSEDEQVKNYMHYCNSYKVSTYLQAGIPLIVHNDISCSIVVEDNHWGIVVNSLEEAVQKVKEMSEDEYHSYVDAIASTKCILENGYFTKKALVNVIYNLAMH